MDGRWLCNLFRLLLLWESILLRYSNFLIMNMMDLKLCFLDQWYSRGVCSFVVTVSLLKRELNTILPFCDILRLGADGGLC